MQKAYRSLAELDEEATSDSLKLWTKKHKKHRGIHLSEIADLQKTAAMTINKQSDNLLSKLKPDKKMTSGCLEQKLKKSGGESL